MLGSDSKCILNYNREAKQHATVGFGMQFLALFESYTACYGMLQKEKMKAEKIQRKMKAGKGNYKGSKSHERIQEEK